jgi:hypothetical protein
MPETQWVRGLPAIETIAIGIDEQQSGARIFKIFMKNTLQAPWNKGCSLCFQEFSVRRICHESN